MLQVSLGPPAYVCNGSPGLVVSTIQINGNVSTHTSVPYETLTWAGPVTAVTVTANQRLAISLEFTMIVQNGGSSVNGGICYGASSSTVTNFWTQGRVLNVAAGDTATISSSFVTSELSAQTIYIGFCAFMLYSNEVFTSSKGFGYIQVLSQ